MVRAGSLNQQTFNQLLPSQSFISLRVEPDTKRNRMLVIAAEAVHLDIHIMGIFAALVDFIKALRGSASLIGLA